MLISERMPIRIITAKHNDKPRTFIVAGSAIIPAPITEVARLKTALGIPDPDSSFVIPDFSVDSKGKSSLSFECSAFEVKPSSHIDLYLVVKRYVLHLQLFERVLYRAPHCVRD